MMVAGLLVLGVGLVGLRRSPAVTFATLMAVSFAMLAASYVLFDRYGVDLVLCGPATLLPRELAKPQVQFVGA